MIKLNNIIKSFDGVNVLNGLNLEISKGETILILGKSGSGKSVTLKLILKLLEVDSGEILIEDEDITNFTERQMKPFRKRMGMLFQGAALFDSMSVWENLAYPLREHSKMDIYEMDERVEEVLGFVNMVGSEYKKPSELSGGMKKRVALARAMIMQPDYMFYDEPTTGLDPLTASKINSLIIKTQENLGVTSVVVTHDLVSAFQVGTKFSFLHEGEIIFFGTADEIRNEKEPNIRAFLKEAQWKDK